MKQNTALIFLILMAACFAVPVTGIDQYLGGSPQMTAYISGVNEFSPGQDATITVVIQNSGTNAVKFVGHSMLAQNDLPTTAKLGDGPACPQTVHRSSSRPTPRTSAILPARGSSPPRSRQRSRPMQRSGTTSSRSRSATGISQTATAPSRPATRSSRSILMRPRSSRSRSGSNLKSGSTSSMPSPGT